MRLKGVVSNAPIADRLRKLRTFSGAESGSISITIFPASVCSVTQCCAIFSTDAPSNGSGLLVAVSSAGLVFFFGGSLTGSAGFGSWPFKERANVNTHAEVHTKQRSQFVLLV